MSKVLDCQKCGACCVGQLVVLLPKDRAQPIHLTEGGAMRLVDNKCAALRGRVGNRVECAVYPSRPEICRRMDPGSYACRNMRHDQLLE